MAEAEENSAEVQSYDEEQSIQERDSFDEQSVHDLAVKITTESLYRVGSEPQDLINPFEDSGASGSALDPHSPNFSARAWGKQVLGIRSRDPEKYPRRTAGVSFKNLSAYGFGTSTDFQKNVYTVLLKAFGGVQYLLGAHKKTRIDILSDFSGVVRSGECCVVLGRPGR